MKTIVHCMGHVHVPGLLDSNKSNWKEDCLSYSPGVTVDLSSRIPGMWLALHDEEGKYQGMARVLKFEGHMLVYNLQTNGAGWTVMCGCTPLTIRETETLTNNGLYI